MQFLDAHEYEKQKNELIDSLILNNSSTSMSSMMIQLFQATHRPKGIWNYIKASGDMIWFTFLLGWGGLMLGILIWYLYELIITFI